MNKLIQYLLMVFLFVSCCDCDEKSSSEKLSSLLDIVDIRDQDSLSKKASYQTLLNQKLNSQASKHYGLDISHFQGILIEKMSPKDSVKFIICKATQGSTFIDNKFRENWRKIKEKGFIRGAYHFYDCSADPIAQAIHFTNQIEDIEPTDIAPILDIEEGSMVSSVSAQEMEKDILTFLKKVEHVLNRKPMIYTNYEFAKQNLKNPVFSDYKLWLAEYNNKAKPLVPDIWKENGFLIWQRSPDYVAFSKHIDLDVAFGNIHNIID